MEHREFTVCVLTFLHIKSFSNRGTTIFIKNFMCKKHFYLKSGIPLEESSGNFFCGMSIFKELNRVNFEREGLKRHNFGV